MPVEKFTVTKPRKSVTAKIEKEEKLPIESTIIKLEKLKEKIVEEQVEEIKIKSKRKKSKPSISEDQKDETIITIKPKEECKFLIK